MIDNHSLALYLEDLLQCTNFEDYAPNGLQVEGVRQISKICTAVTASYDSILYAIEVGAQALIVHHGYFWSGEDSCIIGSKYNKIKKLIQNEINLFAYHLPLDANKYFGNNLMISKLLDIQNVVTYKIGKIANILWKGSFASGINAIDLQKKLSSVFGNDIILLGDKNKYIKNIAWCSGAAQNYFMDGNILSVDAYITGEVSERNYYEALETSRVFFACGHHATEKFGIQAVGDHLQKKFKLEYDFYDSKNPI